jgi:hypothetical protein
MGTRTGGWLRRSPWFGERRTAGAVLTIVAFLAAVALGRRTPVRQ